MPSIIGNCLRVPPTSYAPTTKTGRIWEMRAHMMKNQTRRAHMATETPDEIVANGYAISQPPEDRREPEPGQIFARVWLKEVRHPAIKSGPDDNLDDFAAL